MVKAFEAAGDPVPTSTYFGDIYEVSDDAFFAVIRDDHINGEEMASGWIKLEDILESERHQVQRGMLFYCEVELLDDGDIKKIRSIEFSQELTRSSLSAELRLLGSVITKAEEREV